MFFGMFGGHSFARRLALLEALCCVVAAWSTFSLQPGNDPLLSRQFAAWCALILYVVALSCLAWGAVEAALAKDGVAGWLLFLGFVAGGAMAGVVQYEPDSFWSATLGVLVSLILALAVLERKPPDKKPNPSRLMAYRGRRRQ